MDTKETLQQNILSALKWLWNWHLRIWNQVLTVFLALCLLCGGIWYCLRYLEPEELAIRQELVKSAEGWLGCNEADGSHQQIVDFYNTQDPLPRDYQVAYEDNWCATFGSAAAMEADLLHIIPTECSCEQQILLFEELGRWREDECYLPRPGDYIYYVWDEWRRGDCTAWANHVGIVADTFGPVIKVIEGNKDDQVGYRYIFVNDLCIRGFGVPDYRSAAIKQKNCP